MAVIPIEPLAAVGTKTPLILKPIAMHQIKRIMRAEYRILSFISEVNLSLKTTG